MQLRESLKAICLCNGGTIINGNRMQPFTSASALQQYANQHMLSQWKADIIIAWRSPISPFLMPVKFSRAIPIQKAFLLIKERKLLQ